MPDMQMLSREKLFPQKRRNTGPCRQKSCLKAQGITHITCPATRTGERAHTGPAPPESNTGRIPAMTFRNRYGIAFVNFHTGEKKAGIKNPYRGKFTKYRFGQLVLAGAADGVSIEETGYHDIAYAKYRALVLVYNENHLFTDRKLYNAVKEVSQACRSRHIACIHDDVPGLTAGSKTKTHEALSRAGVPMPEIPGKQGAGPYFVNRPESSGADTQLRPVSKEDLENRNLYITEYTDTTHRSHGRDFFVSIRILAVGSSIVSAYIRTRPVPDRNPCVHSGNTTYDIRVIRDLHHRLITRKSRELAEITDRIAHTPGFAFLAHDILPCTRSGKLLVCETGIKLDAEGHRKRFRVLAPFYPEKRIFSATMMQDSYTALKNHIEEK